MRRTSRPEGDVGQMLSEVGFVAMLLRTELGPGGMAAPDMPEQHRQAWKEAISYLETVEQFPMIPFHFWRRWQEGERGDADQQAQQPRLPD